MLIDELITKRSFIDYTFNAKGTFMKFENVFERKRAKKKKHVPEALKDLTNEQIKSNLQFCHKNKKVEKPAEKKPRKPKKYRWKPTEIQAEIIDFIKKNQPCKGIDVSKNCKFKSTSLSNIMVYPLNNKLVGYDKKTKLWFDPNNKPSEFKVDTVLSRCEDYIKSKGVILSTELKKFTTFPHYPLYSLRDSGLIKNIGHKTWQWVGK